MNEFVNTVNGMIWNQAFIYLCLGLVCIFLCIPDFCNYVT